MAKGLQAIRGMNDILPADIAYWQYVEEVLRQVVDSYGYHEIRFPIVEQTQLFARTIGEVTDIVEKEMYTFEDRNGDSLTLRPEGTAGCSRAGIEHGLLYNQIQRLWYMGPMFRHERPQKGRYRQFHQFGAESYGLSGPDIDVEHILLAARFWQALGIMDQVKLQINSLGTSEDRARYHKDLVAYFEQHQDKLDEDSKRRLYINPLRILDSKNPEMQSINEGAPKLLDYLSDDAKFHFEKFMLLLDHHGIQYEVNPRLVRGLDYYCLTVYEWVTESLGAQNTVCAGGRYDGLVEKLGGKPTPAVGFALGLERLIELVKAQQEVVLTPDVYLVLVGEAAERRGQELAEDLRDQLPGTVILSNCGGGNFKAQLKRADKSGAEIALIIGDDEVEKEVVAVKYLRAERPQEHVAIEQLAEFLNEQSLG